MKNAVPSKHRPRRSRRAAFTLIELLLVLVILATLAGIIIPRFTQRSEQAHTVAAGTEMKNIQLALDSFEIDCGRFPTTDEGLRALSEQPPDLEKWKRPYMPRGVPKDPWGKEYVYQCPGRNNPTFYDLSSHGPDGKEGGGDDIDNWSEE